MRRAAAAADNDEFDDDGVEVATTAAGVVVNEMRPFDGVLMPDFFDDFVRFAFGADNATAAA